MKWFKLALGSGACIGVALILLGTGYLPAALVALPLLVLGFRLGTQAIREDTW